MLITHARVVTFGDPNQIIDDGAVLIDGDRIAAVGATADRL